VLFGVVDKRTLLRCVSYWFPLLMGRLSMGMMNTWAVHVCEESSRFRGLSTSSTNALDHCQKRCPTEIPTVDLLFTGSVSIASKVTRFTSVFD
jgi:hypothetical protein